jgi:hypothetical protein
MDTFMPRTRDIAVFFDRVGVPVKQADEDEFGDVLCCLRGEPAFE